jgi:hypothetical protein
MLPAFRQKRELPWIAAAVSLVVLVLGAITQDRSLALLGVAGLAMVVIAYPLARFLLGPEPPDEAPASEEPPPHP